MRTQVTGLVKIPDLRQRNFLSLETYVSPNMSRFRCIRSPPLGTATAADAAGRPTAGALETSGLTTAGFLVVKSRDPPTKWLE